MCTSSMTCHVIYSKLNIGLMFIMHMLVLRQNQYVQTKVSLAKVQLLKSHQDVQ